jgi:antitoxin component YwqK of YwqJK toxin-antitoxin module
VYELDIVTDYDEYPTFIFTNDTGHKMVIAYYSISDGGHQGYIKNCQNGHLHGTQYRWFDMQHGGHHYYIENYQNGRQHGIQYWWYNMQDGGHQRYIENWQNDQRHGIQYYWNHDKSYYTKIY